MRVSLLALEIVGMALWQRFLRAGYEVASRDIDPRRTNAFADTGGAAVAPCRELPVFTDVCFWARRSAAAARSATDDMAT
jgi:3-hydroxyisobutyrate dehydrogenase-like beta-hydroxyacid dehydrogenase